MGEKMDRGITNANLMSMNIPRKYWDAVVEKCPSPGAVKSVEQVKELFNSSKVVLVVGDVGTGKTYLGTLFMLRAWNEFCSSYMIRMADLMRNKEERFDEGVTVFKQCCDVSLLVLDDVNVELDEWQNKLLRAVLRARIDWKRPTIMVFQVSAANMENARKLIEKMLPPDISQMMTDNEAYTLPMQRSCNV